MYYLPKDGDMFFVKTVGISAVNNSFFKDDLNKVSTYFAYNPFARKLNILTNEIYTGIAEFGLTHRNVFIENYSMIIANEDMSNMKGVALRNNKMKGYLQAHTDTTHMFYGSALGLHTNNLGVTTVIYQQESPYLEFEKYEKNTTRYVGITQYNDNADEIWGTMLQKSNLRSIEGDYPDILYGNSEYELLSTRCVFAKSDIHILFNELDKNFNLELTPITDSMLRYENENYSYDISNAMYYTVNRKKEIQKRYLFDKPADGEYNHIYASSGDYSEEKNLYTVLLRRNKDAKTTLHIGWVEL